MEQQPFDVKGTRVAEACEKFHKVFIPLTFSSFLLLLSSFTLDYSFSSLPLPLYLHPSFQEVEKPTEEDYFVKFFTEK